MILDEDPREKFDALLDTQTHAVFVMKKGVIVRNRLMPAPLESESSDSEKQKEWLIPLMLKMILFTERSAFCLRPLPETLNREQSLDTGMSGFEQRGTAPNAGQRSPELHK